MGHWQPALAEAVFEQPFWTILRQMKWPLILSFCMIAATLAAFIFLNRSLRSQQQLAALKNDFISNITHELKTPVATVSVAIESLKNFNALNSREKTEQYLAISANELKRLNLLIDKVLRQGMFDSGKMELFPEALDLNALVDEVLQSMQLQLEKAGAQVQWHPSAGALPLVADKLQLMSVVFNLVDNAVKYSGVSPQITLTTQKDEKGAVLTVSDKGIGIPVAYQRRVFEKFFRVPAGNAHNAKGYGLGLSYVAEVVAKHKGSIQCISQEGEGSRFVVRLPLAEANAG
jgi:signal transduction histidine kinase